MNQKTRRTSTNVIKVDACPMWSGHNSLFSATAQYHSWPIPAGQLWRQWCFWLLQILQSAFSEQFHPNAPEVFMLPLLRGNTLSHLCSLPFTFYLTTPSESLRAMICLVGEFSCSKETRKYTWALSSMTHLKAAVPAQHNSWSRIHFACAVRGFRAALL